MNKDKLIVRQVAIKGAIELVIADKNNDILATTVDDVRNLQLKEIKKLEDDNFQLKSEYKN